MKEERAWVGAAYTRPRLAGWFPRWMVLAALGLSSQLSPLLATAAAAAGTSRPVYLMLHGWAGDRSTWEPVRSLLGSRALAIELPGHGSDATDVSGWTMGRFVDALEQRREEAGAKCVVLVAHSNGAYFARQYTRRHPDRVASIVVVEGTFVPPFAAADGMRAATRRLGESWPSYVANPAGLQNAKQQTVDVVRTMTARAALRSALATLEILVERDVMHPNPINVPVTFALAQSPHWTAKHVETLRQMAPKSRFIDLGPLSHYAPLDAPAKVATIVRNSSAGQRCAKPSASASAR